MKKLSSEDKKNLLKCLDKLDKIGGDDVAALKDEIAEATNLVADIANKPEPKQRLNIQEMIEDNMERVPVVQRVLEKANEKRIEIFGDKFEEEESILDQDSYIDTLKAAIDINQQAYDLALILLENTPDIYTKGMKKVLDASTENKRILKNIYKGVIDTL